MLLEFSPSFSTALGLPVILSQIFREMQGLFGMRFILPLQYYRQYDEFHDI